MTAPLTSRRALLQGAVMLSAVPVAAKAANLPVLEERAETPIVRLFRQWEQAMDEASVSGLTDEQGEALDVVRHAVQDAIAAEPAISLRDLGIKVLVNSGEGCFGLADALTLECASLAGRNFTKLPGCLFEAVS